MLKIPQTTSNTRLSGLLLLGLAVILPVKAANTVNPNVATLSTLYSFTDLKDGGFPEANLVLGTGGSLFGTASSSDFGLGWGSVFELTPIKTGGWTETTIYSFTGGADGSNPVAGLTLGASSVMYGTTYSGGAYGYGTVYQVAPSGGGVWTQKVLYSFKGGTDGAYPSASLALSSAGVLYGTTYGGGGTGGFGTVFQLGPGGGGVWTEKVLYAFKGGTDGANPLASVVIGSSGQLIGTTSQGGSVTITNQPPTCTTSTPCVYQNWGTVFQLTPKGGGVWSESLLYTFLGGADGGSPESPVILGPSGVLYGNTFWGGTPTACAVSSYPQGCGVVYQLAAPTGGGVPWVETVLHTFTGSSPDGAHPYGNMGLNVSGVLFGTTFAGGINEDICFANAYVGCGTIFSVKPPASPGGAWTKSNLTVFPGSPGGGSPNGLLLSTNGVMYGTTILGGATGGYGTVFQLATGAK